jgi:uncharacterized cupin superfamily protein
LSGGVTRFAIDLASDERVVTLRHRLGIEGLGLNLVTLRRGEGSRIHRHREQEELYLVLEGELTLQLEDDELCLGELELVRVAPAVKRQLWNRRDGACVFLAVGAMGSHAGGDADAFGSWSDPDPRRPSDVPLPHLAG